MILEHCLNVRMSKTSCYIQLDLSAYSQKVLDTLSTYLGTGPKTRKFLLPSDTVDCIAKEEVERSEGDQLYIDNFSYRSILEALFFLPQDGCILCCGPSIEVWVQADKGNMYIDNLFTAICAWNCEYIWALYSVAVDLLMQIGRVMC